MFEIIAKVSKPKTKGIIDGRRFQTSMWAAGFNNYQLALKLGCNPSRVTDWIKGTNDPSAANLFAAADLLEVTVYWLTGEAKEKALVRISKELAAFNQPTTPAPIGGKLEHFNAPAAGLGRRTRVSGRSRGLSQTEEPRERAPDGPKAHPSPSRPHPQEKPPRQR
jgi:transcriptional regulator with XRE-family HTH domain